MIYIKTLTNMKIISILLSVLIFGSCQNKTNGKLDTELINNPTSANETDLTKLPDIKFENEYNIDEVKKATSLGFDVSARSLHPGPSEEEKRRNVSIPQ